MRDDIELLTAWRGGDRAAGNELFDRHVEAVRRFFSSKVASGVEDLVQQTLMACVQARDRIQAEHGFRPYLFATARSKLFDHLRKKGRGPAIDGGTVSVADLGVGPSTALAARQHEQLVAEALRRIPIDLQVALELYYFEGMRGPELSRALEIPEGTVRSRVRRGLEMLRKRVDEIAQTPGMPRETATRLATWAARLEADRQGAKQD